MSSELDRQGLLDIFVMEAAEALVALSAAVNPPGDALPSPKSFKTSMSGRTKSEARPAFTALPASRSWENSSKPRWSSPRPSMPALWLKTVGILRGGWWKRFNHNWKS